MAGLRLSLLALSLAVMLPQGESARAQNANPNANQFAETKFDQAVRQLELAVLRSGRVPPETTLANLQDLTNDLHPAIANGARFQTGMLYFQRGQWALAQAAWEELRASLENPDHRTAVVFWLGCLQAKAGKSPQAITWLREIADGRDDHPLRRAAIYHLAEVYSQKRQHQEMAETLDRLINSGQKDVWYHAAALRRLDRLMRQHDLASGDALAAKLLAGNTDADFARQIYRKIGRAKVERQVFAEAIAPLQAVVNSSDFSAAPSQVADRPVIFPEAALHLDPPDVIRSPAVPAEDWYWLICAQVAGGKMNDARVSLDRAAKLDAAPAVQSKLLLARGLVEQSLGDWNASAKALEEFAAKFPKDEELPRALEMLSTVRVAATSPAPTAAEPASPVIVQTPPPAEPADATWQFALREDKAGNIDAALAAYHRCIAADLPSPHLASALRAAARLHARLEQYREAAELLDRFILGFPQSPELDAAWMQMAQVRSAQGDRAGSLAALKQVSEKFPTSPLLTSARHHLAVEAVRDHRFAEARDLLKKIPPARTDDPQAADRLLLAGQVSAALQRWSEVDPPLAELESKFPQSPLRPTARFWRGEAAWRKGDGVAAISYLEPLLSDESSRAAPWRPAAILRTTQQHLRAEKWDDAITWANCGAAEASSAALKPEFEYLAGYALSRKGDWAAARQRLELAARDPRCNPETSARSLWLIGESLAQEGKIEAGIQAWLRLETRTDLPNWKAAGVLRAAECRESQGEVDEARSLYARLVRQYASTEQGEEASRRLLQLAPADIAESGREGMK